MSSNSVRVGADLFEAAREHGQLMSRSAALQLEHWARLGMALEATGLSVTDVAALLREANPVARAADDAGEEVPEQALWAHKRANQARDVEMVRSGRSTNEQMSWFSGGRAKSAQAVDSPY